MEPRNETENLWTKMIESPNVPTVTEINQLLEMTLDRHDYETIFKCINKSISSSNRNEVFRALLLLHYVHRDGCSTFPCQVLSTLDSLRTMTLFWLQHEDERASSLLLINYGEYLRSKLDFLYHIKHVNSKYQLFVPIPETVPFLVESLTSLLSIADPLIACFTYLSKNIDATRLSIVSPLLIDSTSLVRLTLYVYTKLSKTDCDEEYFVYATERLKYVYVSIGTMCSKFSSSTFLAATSTLRLLPAFPSSDIFIAKLPIIKSDKGLTSKEVDVLDRCKNDMRKWYDYHPTISDEQLHSTPFVNKNNHSYMPDKFEPSKHKSIHKEESGWPQLVKKIGSILEEMKQTQQNFKKYLNENASSQSTHYLLSHLLLLSGYCVELVEYTIAVVRTKRMSFDSNSLGITLSKSSQTKIKMLQKSEKIDKEQVVACKINISCSQLLDFGGERFGVEHQFYLEMEDILQQIYCVTKDLSVETITCFPHIKIPVLQESQNNLMRRTKSFDIKAFMRRQRDSKNIQQNFYDSVGKTPSRFP
ncbi:AP180 N-terminal-like protein (ANTH) domain-containing protein [Entamoeba marina]